LAGSPTLGYRELVGEVQVLGELKFVLSKATFSDQHAEDISQNRISIVVCAIDPLPAFGQIVLQIPEIRPLFDFARHLLCIPDDGLKFSIQSKLKSFAGDLFFGVWPLEMMDHLLAKAESVCESVDGITGGSLRLQIF
jgi:hypothetical protein